MATMTTEHPQWETRREVAQPVTAIQWATAEEARGAVVSCHPSPTLTREQYLANHRKSRALGISTGTMEDVAALADGM